MAPTPLPDNPYPLNSAFFAAYETCEGVERSNTVVHNGPTPALSGQILGYMLIHAPTDEGRTNVRNEIVSRETEAKLMDLAQFYLDRFIRVFKRATGRTPAEGFHSSQTSFDYEQQLTQQHLDEAPKNHQNARDWALIRDNHRCLITGGLDVNDYERQVALDPAFDTPWTFTNAAHITGLLEFKCRTGRNICKRQK
ncbi:hypothetical protein FRB94_004807 [Tulasnella sp. JGI-2019a]|nr:hypothetical protein FRB94_004807 [Tulasnella sp. JGI-2019a]